MKKKAIICFGLLIMEFLFFCKSAFSAYELNENQLRRELALAGYKILGKADFYGVPCLRIVLPVGQAIYQICRKVPLLNKHYSEAREAIAFINGLNYSYPRGYDGWPNQTKKDIILIPLNTIIQPKIFPGFEREYERYSKFILIDRPKQFLAYYENGHLIAFFPVSTGRQKKKTPPMEGWISLRDQNHISSIYNVLMPFSLLLVRPYFLHAGVMPGTPDSAGCIRLFMEHAQWLFSRISDKKTRFKVI